MPIEQEERLREMSAWYFINYECIDSVRSWVVSKEDNIWFTSKNGHTLFAIVTDAQDWKEGVRKTFLIRSAVSGANTKVSVLGQNSAVIEYKNDDVSCRYQQTTEGMEVSVVKAQRIYDDHRWPNPVVIKLENVNPAFAEAVQVETGQDKVAAKGMLLTGHIVKLKNKKVQHARFNYRSYNGQVETLYAGAWQHTQWADIKADGSFEILLTGLTKGSRYEFKAVAKQENVEIEGENKVLTVR